MAADRLRPGWGILDNSAFISGPHAATRHQHGFALVPERRAGVVVLANMDSVNSGGLAEEILKIVLDLHEAESKISRAFSKSKAGTAASIRWRAFSGFSPAPRSTRAANQ